MTDRERDLSPSADVPLLDWGDPLPMRWNARDDGSVFVLSQRIFMTRHGDGRVMWREDDHRMHGPFEAYHVPYPDGGRGVAKRQLSGLGMVNLNDRPWRLLSNGRSWWPGELTIFRDRLVFTDHGELMRLWMPNEATVALLAKGEFAGRPIPDDRVYWPQLYIALARHEGFLEAVRDDDFAASVFVFLRDRDIQRKCDGRQVLVGSDRRFGDMLGAWRRCGESYLDFYCDLGPGQPSDDCTPLIEQVLQEVGYVAV